MNDLQSLNHTKWECKYHVVFIPKRRRKVLYGELRRNLGEVFRTLTEQKESRIELLSRAALIQASSRSECLPELAGKRSGDHNGKVAHRKLR